eukprot:3933470-Rhodomonas_salina.2
MLRTALVRLGGSIDIRWKCFTLAFLLLGSVVPFPQAETGVESAAHIHQGVIETGGRTYVFGERAGIDLHIDHAFQHSIWSLACSHVRSFIASIKAGARARKREDGQI